MALCKGEKVGKVRVLTYHTMGTYRRVEVKLHDVLTLELDECVCNTGVSKSYRGQTDNFEI